MLFRFCLYGFLKNQRYFEPFMMLALLAKDLSFFQVGVLYSIRWFAINLLEILSGAIADQWGRRRCMMLSFSAYVISFLTFGIANDFVSLCFAMILFGVGDSFRTGTHKAMIFHWLERQGRTDERTKVYGTTRRWSKFGSGVGAILSAGFLLYFERFDAIFFLAAVPSFLNLVNFLGYPKYLEYHTPETAPSANPEPANSASTEFEAKVEPKSMEPKSRTGAPSLTGPWVALRSTWQHVRGSPPIRNLLLESMAWEGVFHAVKDYLQPVLVVLCTRWFAQTALNIASPDAVSESETNESTILVIALAYAAMNFSAGWVSGRAYQFSSWSGSTRQAQLNLWLATATCYAVALLGCLWDDKFGLAVGLVATSLITILILQNIWQPILVASLDEYGDSRYGATLLSMESQSQRVTTMVLAPILGFSIDWTSGGLAGGFQTHSVQPMWPLALLGLLASIAILVRRRLGSPSERVSDEP